MYFKETKMRRTYSRRRSSLRRRSQNADLSKYGIKELRDGLTLEEIKQKWPWILKADIENAILGKDGSFLEWYNGVWRNGIWEGPKAEWKNGTWLNGTWKDGWWYGGTWHNGTWENGDWDKGTWLNGTWKGGRWYGGTWHNGTWENGSWWRGTWLNGTWENGFWEGGTWCGGIWKNGKWPSGTTWVDCSGNVYNVPPSEWDKAGPFTTLEQEEREAEERRRAIIFEAKKILRKMAPAFKRGLRYFDNLFDEGSYAVGFWIGELDHDVWKAAKEEGLFEDAGFPSGEITAEGFYHYEYIPHSSIYISGYDDAATESEWREIFSGFKQKFASAVARFHSSIPAEARNEAYDPVIDLMIRVPEAADRNEFLRFVKSMFGDCRFDEYNPDWIQVFYE